MLGAEVVEEIGYTTTHVLTYRRADQVFDTKNVLRRFGVVLVCGHYPIVL